MKKRQVLLSEAQWEILAPLFPKPKRRKDRRGRPWAPNRDCLKGILWVLRTGARWRDMPEQYPDGSTCWRRLRGWEEQGIWLKAWQKLLSMLDQRRLLDWGSLPGRHFHHRQKGGSAVGKTRRGKGTKCIVVVNGRGVPVGANLRPRSWPSVGSRKHAGYCKGAAQKPGTTALSSEAGHCRSRLRF